MFEAELYYNNGRKHIVEANTIGSLECKLKPFIEADNVWVINVYEKKYIKNMKGSK